MDWEKSSAVQAKTGEEEMMTEEEIEALLEKLEEEANQ